MRQTPPSKTWFQKIEKQHPYETLLYLAMLGSGIIFLFLSLLLLMCDRNRDCGLAPGAVESENPQTEGRFQKAIAIAT